MRSLVMVLFALAWSLPLSADELQSRLALADVDRGRLVFGACRTLPYSASSR